MAVKNRVRILMGQKQAQEDRQINAAIVARETGLTPQAVSMWVNNEITVYKSKTIQIWCDYFDCTVGDLLVYEPQAEPEATPEC